MFGSNEMQNYEVTQGQREIQRCTSMRFQPIIACCGGFWSRLGTCIMASKV